MGDEPRRVEENRRRLAESMGFQGVVTTPQVHGVQVLVVDRSNAEQALSTRADILMTRHPGLLLMQRFADCVPLLFWHESAGAVAVAHAGWRGTALGVAGAAVSALQEHAGANPEGARAAIGPSIGPCCFEVGTEVVERFSDADGAVSQGSRGRPHVNLWELNRRALVAAGVPGDRIEVAGVCTRCQSDTFFSHRAMGYPAGRFGAAIGLRAHHE